LTTLRFFGLNFNAVPLSVAAEQIVNAADNGQKGLVVTPNVDHIVMLETDMEMRHIFRKAMFCYPDGMPLVWLSRLIRGVSFPERVTGADLLPTVCKIAAQRGKRVFFLGGQQGVAEKAAQNMGDKFSGLQVAGTYCPPMGFEHDQLEEIKIIELVNKAKVDIVFLGVGTPKQEKWAWKNIQQLHVGPILCVGAALDFAAGITKRAPDQIQRAGLEWLWRLCKEPRRLWKRYLLRDSRFLAIALREIFISYFQHRSE
jgi:N-acetylglucosaminyldiphosphoundecaprenol N-acetyl-beta-D-mannosaminyltransferase